MSATRDEVLLAMAEASCGNSSRAHAEARIRDALAAAEQAGWRLVPKVADEGILHVMDLCASGRVVMSKQEAWHNMLAAAPKVTP